MSQDYDAIRDEVRALAMSLPPSDLGSARAVSAITEYVVAKLAGEAVGPFKPYRNPRAGRASPVQVYQMNNPDD